ncbi:MAG TPA: hypothetical protein VLL75_15790 [Vicinamibacteria bacterium]|nr:hypothetical protein [Vicinamibacteria bacterium]
MKTSLFAVILVAALAAPSAADRAEDDLQLVRKAVASSSRVAEARPPAEEPPAEARPAARKGEPRWLRVRITEKAGKHGRVSINLPIGIARALGEDWPISHRECRKDRCPTLGEILRALDSGQSLVEIEDDGATVRVWVD